MDPAGAGQPLGLQQEEVQQPAPSWGGPGSSQQPGSSTYGNMMDLFLDDTCPTNLFTDLLDPATLAAMAGSSDVTLPGGAL